MVFFSQTDSSAHSESKDKIQLLLLVEWPYLSTKFFSSFCENAIHSQPKFRVKIWTLDMDTLDKTLLLTT